MAVEQLAGEAVLGEAPEDLCFTVDDLNRVVNFFLRTEGRCTDERARMRCVAHARGRSQVHPRTTCSSRGSLELGAGPVGSRCADKQNIRPKY